MHPEEIKIGLECCSSGECKHCPYRNYGGGTYCIPALTGDARSLILRLEANQEKPREDHWWIPAKPKEEKKND